MKRHDTATLYGQVTRDGGAPARELTMRLHAQVERSARVDDDGGTYRLHRTGPAWETFAVTIDLHKLLYALGPRAARSLLRKSVLLGGAITCKNLTRRPGDGRD